MVDYDTTLQKLDKTGKQELNKILKDDSAGDYAVVNIKGGSKQYFPKELGDENRIVMNNGNYMLSFVPIFEQEENNSNEDESNSVRKNEAVKAMTAKIKGDTITYEPEESDIEYQYTSLTNGVKEDIILNSKPDTNEFSFKIETKNLELELLAGYGGINLKDKKTGEAIGYIMPPNITDADKNVNYEDIKYKLEETKKETIIKLVVSEGYFNNENLAYPVKIDPTLVWFNNKLATAVVCSASVISGSNLHGENLYVNNKAITTGVFAGSEQRVYLDTSKVAVGDCFIQGPGNISGKYIESVELSLMEALAVS